MKNKRIAFLYSTREGQTLKILNHIENKLNQQGEISVDYFNLHDEEALLGLNLSHYEHLLVAASIRYGSLNPKLYRFIAENHLELADKNASFICVNLTARKEEQGKDTPEGSVYIKTFLKKSRWQPKDIAVFAGALRYPRYRWFDKFMIRLIMSMTGGETNTSKEVEYTNWNKVDAFADLLFKKIGK